MLLQGAELDTRPARTSDITLFARRIRARDADECWAVAHYSPAEALQYSLDVSTVAWSAFHQGRPVAMFGVAPMPQLPGTGVPWMLATDEIKRASRPFARQSIIVIQAMHDYYPHLTNYVDTRNALAKRWLRWLGFKIHRPEAFGIEGLPFHRFERLRESFHVRG